MAWAVERPTFWERNKSKLVTIAVGTMLGTASAHSPYSLSNHIYFVNAVTALIQVLVRREPRTRTNQYLLLKITRFIMGCGFVYRSRRAGDKHEDGPQVNVDSSSSRPDSSSTPSGARAFFLGGFFEWVRSHIPKLRNKKHKSCHASKAPAPRPASQDPIVRSSPTLHQSSASSVVRPTSIADSKPAVSQQNPEFVEDGLRVHVEPPPNDKPLPNTDLSKPDQCDEISIGDARRFSEEDLRAIQSGLLKLRLVSQEGPEVEIKKYQDFRVSTPAGGKSHIRSTLPVYSARHCRPDADNPTVCIYVEVNALWYWGQNGSMSIAFSVQDNVGSAGLGAGSLAIRGESGSLYYNDVPLGPEFGRFTSGWIGLGLLLQYKEAKALVSDPCVDIKVFHTREGKVVEVIPLGRDMLGFDGRHDLFVDVQTFDETAFEVVLEKNRWWYKPVTSELMLWPCGMEIGSNISL